MKVIEVYEVNSNNTKITIASDRITIKVSNKDMLKENWANIAQQLSTFDVGKTLRSFVRFTPMGFVGILRDNSKKAIYRLTYYSVVELIMISEIKKDEELRGE